MANIVGASFSKGQRRKGVDLAFKDLYQRGVFSALNSNLFIEYNYKDGNENGYPLFVDDYLKNLKQWIVDSHKQSGFTITIGGDHTVALSSVYAAKEVYEDLALIWIDAHADFNNAESSVTKNLHGLPLNGIVNGQKTFKVDDYDSDSFWMKSSIFPSLPSFNPFAWLGNGALRPEKIALIGIRDVDPEEKRMLLESGMHVYWMDDIKKNGIDKTIKSALRAITNNLNTKIHVSFDVDVLDPREFSATGCHCPDGMTVNEVKYILKKCVDSKLLVSFDLVEYNPLINKDTEAWKVCYDILQVLHDVNN